MRDLFIFAGFMTVTVVAALGTNALFDAIYQTGRNDDAKRQSKPARHDQSKNGGKSLERPTVR